MIPLKWRFTLVPAYITITAILQARGYSIVTDSPLLQQAAQYIIDGKLVAFPTETVYGLGADATNDDAVKEIFRVKGRPSSNPLIIHVSEISTILQYGEVPLEHSNTFSKLSTTFCPGPLTFVLNKRSGLSRPLSNFCSANAPTAAFRIPAHDTALKLIQLVNRPIAAPSANPSNYISPTTAKHVHASLGHQISLIIDGGPCPIGVESTVISLLPHRSPTLLRPGGITLEQLQEVSGEEFTIPSDQTADTSLSKSSPGQLALHYSPRTRLIYRGTPDITYPTKTGLIEFFPSPHEHAFSMVKTLSVRGDLTEVAKNLFSSLRELDESGLELIIVDRCNKEGIGRAILDRLNRAVHK